MSSTHPVPRKSGFVRSVHFPFALLVLAMLLMTINMARLVNKDIEPQYPGTMMAKSAKGLQEKIVRLEKHLNESFVLLESQQREIEELEARAKIHGRSTRKESPSGLLSRVVQLEQSIHSVNGSATNATHDIQTIRSRLENAKRARLEDESRMETLKKEVSQIKQDFYSEFYLSHDKSSLQEILSDERGYRYLHPLSSYSDTFCHPWEISYDEWWTHHPEWFVSKESDDKYCFSLMKPSMQSKLYRDLYNVQFRGSCSKVISKKMMNSGWGVDMANLVDGLMAAKELKRPFQVTQGPWHYANDKKNVTNAACPEKNQNCYLLPLSRCDHNPQRVHPKTFFYEYQPQMDTLEGQWYLEYATRPRTWLRKAVYDFTKTVNLTSPCTAMHVRRGDVVLHRNWARKYYAIADYVKAASNQLTKDILLLTDDANAIEEARNQFPDYNWITIDRPRFRGKEGGWENHIPSHDPKREVIILMSIFRLVEQCNVFVHSRSNLAEYIAGIMRMNRKQKFIRVDLNQGQSYGQVYDAKNSETVPISQSAQSNITF